MRILFSAWERARFTAFFQVSPPLTRGLTPMITREWDRNNRSPPLTRGLIISNDHQTAGGTSPPLTRGFFLLYAGLRRAILTTGKPLYRVVILKRDIPASSRKTIVRNTLKCSVLTIVDSDVLKEGS